MSLRLPAWRACRLLLHGRRLLDADAKSLCSRGGRLVAPHAGRRRRRGVLLRWPLDRRPLWQITHDRARLAAEVEAEQFGAEPREADVNVERLRDLALRQLRARRGAEVHHDGFEIHRQRVAAVTRHVRLGRNIRCRIGARLRDDRLRDPQLLLDLERIDVRGDADTVQPPNVYGAVGVDADRPVVDVHRAARRATFTAAGHGHLRHPLTARTIEPETADVYIAPPDDGHKPTS